MRTIDTDYLIVGSGIAGLAAALWASRHGKVTVVSKDNPDDCNSSLAQGGIAAAVGPGDSPELHCLDTLQAGAGACTDEVVKLLTSQAPEIVQTLLKWGVRFDKTPTGTLSLAREGAHGQARVLYHGDRTGAEIWQALYKKLKATGEISLLPKTRVVELQICRGKCVGATALFQEEPIIIRSRGTALATGGCGQVFLQTTNSPASTGDGLALAWRAGAELVDMEYVQFHPTALDTGDSPMFLISEAVRGEGAILINCQGGRFMQDYHPQADLAPRDVVSRAIYSELAKGYRVYLDATSIGSNFSSRFPTIWTKLSAHGIDPTQEPIPVTPAAHFLMGGIKTDSFGRTRVKGLFACGEAACTGVHGANRLASNSLLEGLVFARRVAISLTSSELTVSLNKPIEAPRSAPLILTDPRVRRLQEIMWSRVGIIRSGQRLVQAYAQLLELESEVNNHESELLNMLLIAKLITVSALNRPESRGSHFRSDYPLPKHHWQKRHLVPRRSLA